MNGRPELQMDHVVRNRLIGRIGKAPITVVCGLFGTGKGKLLNQWYESVRDKSQIVRVDLPRRHLSEAQTVYRILEAALGPSLSDQSVVRVMDQLRRGNIDPDRLKRQLQDHLHGLAGRTLLLVSYEWQSTSFLDHMLVDLTKHGINVICALLDATDLARYASDGGVTLDTIMDADLVMGVAEISGMAQHYGIEPDASLIWRVKDIAGGYPALSALMLLRLSGVSGAVYENGVYRPVWGQESHPTAMVKIDPSRVNDSLVREACSFLRVQGDRITSLLDTPQGNGRFMRTCRAMVGVKRVSVDAVTGIVADDDDLDGQERIRGDLQRLVDAGYGIYEVGSEGELEFVWKSGVRQLLRTYLIADRQSCDAIVPVSAWYAHRNRLDEMMRMVEDGGDIALLEAVCSRYLVDILWSLKLDVFEPDRWKDLTAPRRTPTVMLLIAIAQRRHGDLDEPLQRGVEAVLCTMRSAVEAPERRAAMSVRDLVTTLVEGEISMFLLNRWSASPDWERWMTGLLGNAVLAGELDTRERSRLTIQTGMISLLRMHLSDAETGLALAWRSIVARSGKVRALAELGLRLLEDVTGDDLNACPADTAVNEIKTVGLLAILHEESLILMELAIAWHVAVQHDPKQALKGLTAFVREHPQSAEVPIVQWSLEVMSLFAGQYARAYAALQRRTSDGPMEDSPYSDLIIITDALVTLRVGGSLRDMRWPSGDVQVRINPVVEMLQAMYVNDDVRLQECLERVDGAPFAEQWPIRFRVCEHMLQAAAVARLGDDVGAGRHLALAVSIGTSQEIAWGLRLLSRSDVLRFSVAQGLHVDLRGDDGWQDLLKRSLAVEHVLPDDTDSVFLSEAQLGVLRKAAEGLSNQRIAEELFLSVNTVKSHLRKIYRLLGVSNRSDAVSAARTMRLL